MNTQKLIFRSLLVMSLSSVVITGCKREEEDNDTSAANDNSFAEGAYNDIGVIADQASYGSLSTYRNSSGDDGSFLSACATITFDSIIPTDPDTLLVDFGPTNCQCSDLRYRRGQIQVVYSGAEHYRDSNFTATITPINYYVNDYKVEGTKTILNKGHISNNRLTWTINVSGTITKPNNGGTITWTSSRTKILNAGETTYGGPINWGIAKWELHGSANGTAANGENFTAQIDDSYPLVRDMTCLGNRRFIQAGKLDFTPGSRPVRHINFGDNSSYACDDIATVTINNNTYTIHMH